MEELILSFDEQNDYDKKISIYSTDLTNLIKKTVTFKPPNIIELHYKKFLFFGASIELILENINLQKGYLRCSLKNTSSKEAFKKIIKNNPYINNPFGNIVVIDVTSIISFDNYANEYEVKDIFIEGYVSIAILLKEKNLLENEETNDKDYSVITTILHAAAMLDEEEKELLKREAQKYSLNTWKNIQRGTVGGVGFATGLMGGLVGLALEAADFGFLAARLGRAIYGIGHILRKEVNYEEDIENILMIWSGMGKGVKKEALKNSAVFITEKLVINKGDIKKVADDIDIEEIETNFVNLNTATGAIAGKIIAKTGTKGSIKMLSKVMAASIKNKVLAKAVSKASAKLTAKITAKMSSKWIPIIGGGTSAAINIWVINSLMDAAEEYYKNDFILIQDKE